MKKITIYTDGACSPNPGAGGWGALLIYDKTKKELSGGFKFTTNNRMEILAVIESLKALKERCNVKLYTDSQYVYNSVTKGWAQNWRSNGWRKGKKKKEKALNPDLWGQLLDLLDQHNVEMNWVRGHNDNPGNERCDELAVSARLKGNLPDDPGYPEPDMDNEHDLFT